VSTRHTATVVYCSTAWALDGGEAGHDGMLGREGQAVLRALRAATAVRSHITRALSTVWRVDTRDTRMRSTGYPGRKKCHLIPTLKPVDVTCSTRVSI